MWAVVGCVGLFAAWRNLTAFALTASWLVGQIYYLRTGNSLALGQYFMADIAVVTVIFAKAIVSAGAKTYPTAWRQFKAFATDLTVCDRFILGLFLLGAWPIYVSTIHPYYQWWLLFYITIAQFLFAGAEPLARWWSVRRARRQESRHNILQFAPAYSRRAQRYFGAEPPPSYRSVNHSRSMRGEGYA